MLTLAWPWLAAVAPAPLLVAWLAPPVAQGNAAAVSVPFFRSAATWPAGRAVQGRSPRAWVAALAWLALVLAACRPQWVGEEADVAVTGRDLLLAVDVSGSMEQSDLRRGGKPVSRLEIVKSVAGEFVSRRRGDRVGLVLFGTRAYLQAPLTFDLATVRTLLDEAVVGLAGQQTAIGDAIGLAVKRLRKRPQEQRVLVLLTDGRNTAGEAQPREAARVAAAAGLRIHTIGVGAEEIVVRSVLGPRRINPSMDLDEDTLRAVAEATGGRYFRARATEELAQAYALLERLEPSAAGDERLRPRGELFHWPLALALAIAAALAALRLAAAHPRDRQVPAPARG